MTSQDTVQSDVCKNSEVCSTDLLFMDIKRYAKAEGAAARRLGLICSTGDKVKYEKFQN